jgi:pimeloyl-ACP methyl ester carboxylesterase
MRRLIDALTVAGKPMGQLQARLILVHGRTDNIIPYTQSEALARAVPSGQAQLFLLDGFGHANLQGLSLKDGWRLWRAVDDLLGQRR